MSLPCGRPNTTISDLIAPSSLDLGQREFCLAGHQRFIPRHDSQRSREQGLITCKILSASSIAHPTVMIAMAADAPRAKIKSWPKRRGAGRLARCDSAFWCQESNGLVGLAF